MTLFFDSLNKELSPGFHLVDTFLNYFSFLSVNQKNPDVLTFHYNRLINIFENLFINQDTVVIITNTSIKNNIATSVSHMYKRQKVITKSVYHAINITSIKAELFAIRCEINYAV